jgi:tetratricopeptide (TPR) repeat protein
MDNSSKPSSLEHGTEEEQAKLYATLRFVDEGLSESLKPLLVPVAMHEDFLDADFLEAMAQGRLARSEVTGLVDVLLAAGLLKDMGQATYQISPSLTSYLRSTCLANTLGDVRDAWARAFVAVMGHVADKLAPVQFDMHATNLRNALGEAERLAMDPEFVQLAEPLALHALNTHNLSMATELYQHLLEISNRVGARLTAAEAYHQLGIIADEQRDFAAAEAWFRKSLAITDELGDEVRATPSYYHLGAIARMQGDFAAARAWYRKVLASVEKSGDQEGLARAYNELGLLEEQQGDLVSAAEWYRKLLATSEQLGNESFLAMAYHQLGNIALKQRDFAGAGTWYHKSLAITEKVGDKHGAALTCHQLGVSAEQKRDFASAEAWYSKSLAMKLLLGD